MSIVSTLIKAEYAATEAQVEILARDVVNGEQADSTYLRVFLVRVQANLSDRKRKTRGTQLAAINTANELYYPHIMKGVGSSEISQKERNRRATFARTVASTVRAFVRAGGDVRTVDVATATKAKLASFGRPVPKGTRDERVYQKAQEAIIRAAHRLAKYDTHEAKERIEDTIHVLEDMLKRWEGKKAEGRRAPSERPRLH